MSAAAARTEFKPLPIRSRTGTADFHMSRASVDMGLTHLDKLSDIQAIGYLANCMWGSQTEMPCPHCNTFDAHYGVRHERRWKCKSCERRFSVTSGTVFAYSKLPIKTLLKIVFSWCNGSAGKPALQLRRDWGVAYSTAYMLTQKLREGLERGFIVGLLAGVHEMDGMDINGRRYKEKRGRPQSGGRGKAPSIRHELLGLEEGSAQGAPVPDPSKTAKIARQPPSGGCCSCCESEAWSKARARYVRALQRPEPDRPQLSLPWGSDTHPPIPSS